MHLLILGGTGPSGIQLIEQALARHHTVVVYARSPDKLPSHITASPSVTVVVGGLADKDKLTAALDGVHAVLSALGPAVKNGPFHPGNTPLANGYELLLACMKARDVKRLIALGTASMADEHDKFSFEFSVLVTGVAVFAHNAYKDVVQIGKNVRAADLDVMWTLARVPLLTEKESKEYLAGYVGDGKTKTRLSRAAFGAFVMDELEQNQWCRKAPLLSSP
ncbi:NAD-P-binding protein [Epithele typhae]|uniref:NAD-P-binding protein n=1 Tax=Epithele typhae TaxID=378194 RepID=UPI0020072D57|nr:NAD-P-binding protein [Epithele typhae]KAH9912769.1 NAD-P-binding protein [Epithele typhae]